MPVWLGRLGVPQVQVRRFAAADGPGMGPFPGDLELVVLLSGTVMQHTRGWPLTPWVAMAINRAVASQAGALWGVITSELGTDHTVPIHGQYAYLFVLSAEAVAEAETEVREALVEVGQPADDAAHVRRLALDTARIRAARQLASCLEKAWPAMGHGLHDTGLATPCGPYKALKLVELLFIYPFKCLVHLHESELRLGLGACTLGWSPGVGGGVLRLVRCKEVDAGCILGSTCKGHGHCRPPNYVGAVASFTACAMVGLVAGSDRAGYDLRVGRAGGGGWGGIKVRACLNLRTFALWASTSPGCVH